MQFHQYEIAYQRLFEPRVLAHLEGDV